MDKENKLIERLTTQPTDDFVTDSFNKIKPINYDGITLNMNKIIEEYKGKIGSIDNGTIIQQISLFCQNNYHDYRKPVLLDMINPKFTFTGLYPHTHKIRGSEVAFLDSLDDDFIKQVQSAKDIILHGNWVDKSEVDMSEVDMSEVDMSEVDKQYIFNDIYQARTKHKNSTDDDTK
jgi:hypothetical protein